MAGSPKISGALIFRLIGIVLIFFFHSLFFGIVLIAFAGRLSTALGLDEKLAQWGSAARSLPRKNKRARRPQPKAVRQKESLAPCPYCGREIKPNTRKCPHCNHTL
jgi:hypothetical protein